MSFFPHSVSFSGDSSRFLHLSIICSYLQLSRILWFKCTTICVTIHSRTSGLVPGLVYYENICIHIYVWICFHGSVLNNSAVAGLYSSSVILLFEQTSKIFSRTAITLYIPTTRYEWSSFSMSPAFSAVPLFFFFLPFWYSDIYTAIFLVVSNLQFSNG